MGGRPRARRWRRGRPGTPSAPRSASAARPRGSGCGRGSPPPSTPIGSGSARNGHGCKQRGAAGGRRSTRRTEPGRAARGAGTGRSPHAPSRSHNRRPTPVSRRSSSPSSNASSRNSTKRSASLDAEFDTVFGETGARARGRRRTRAGACRGPAQRLGRPPHRAHGVVRGSLRGSDDRRIRRDVRSAHRTRSSATCPSTERSPSRSTTSPARSSSRRARPTASTSSPNGTDRTEADRDSIMVDIERGDDGVHDPLPHVPLARHRWVNLDVTVPQGVTRDHQDDGGCDPGRRVGGPVAAETQGGAINVNGAVGDASLETMGGSIAVTEHGARSTVHTKGGSIRSRARSPAGSTRRRWVARSGSTGSTERVRARDDGRVGPRERPPQR